MVFAFMLRLNSGHFTASVVPCIFVSRGIQSQCSLRLIVQLFFGFGIPQILSPLGRISEALSDLTKAIQLQPSARLYRHRGTLLFISEVWLSAWRTVHVRVGHMTINLLFHPGLCGSHGRLPEILRAEEEPAHCHAVQRSHIFPQRHAEGTLLGDALLLVVDVLTQILVQHKKSLKAFIAGWSFAPFVFKSIHEKDFSHVCVFR